MARSMGVRVGATRARVVIATALLAGTVTAFCGPVGFLGVAVPHLARGLLRTGDHRWLLPACALAGAAVALVSDLVAQLPGREGVLPLNAVTALVGAPVLAWVVLRRRGAEPWS
jgi:iron complex transport system permease protein